MVDVDERVVQMKFDSSDFESKTKSTFKILDTLKEKLSFKSNDSAKNLEEINDNIQKMADKAYTIIDRVIDKIRDDIANKLVGFIKENTVGQIASAWDKYANMTTSVATLRAQGYAMETINEQLSRLNYFTDETSYNFTSMVGEIGKFTAAGKSLEDSTLAMMGIAEWAALSGKNANEASRAMYQLSQALGAGTMRMQDWKSIQNLNMDTREFRKNAIEAAIELGTLKDNLDGTYTSLKNSKVTFGMDNFAESLTKGAWFDSNVMMAVYSLYGSAVDELRALYEEGGEKMANGIKYDIHTTADAIQYVKAKNEEILTEFDKKGVSRDEADKLLKRWKKVQKATDEVVDNYAEINNLTDKQKEQYRKSLNDDYAKYLKEYSEIFKDSEKNAEEALDDWSDYVSSFGLKAFGAAQEAKTFLEALESAKDAASTVWTGIFTKIFGDYDEAKELWTDFANALYEIFVDRLWGIDDIFAQWKEEGGRTAFWQGIYGIFGGFKEAIMGIRKGWDALFNETGVDRGAQRLLKLSEGIRNSGARFYLFIKDLQGSEFFKNIAQSVMNIIKIFRSLRDIVLNVIKIFFPNGEVVKGTLLKISELLKNVTAKLIPTQRAATNMYKIIRGFVSLIKIIAKIVKGFFDAILPAGVTLWDIFTSIGGAILEFLGYIGDLIYATDQATDSTNAFKTVFGGLIDIFKNVGQFIGPVLRKALNFVKPVFIQIKSIILSLASTIKKVFTGTGIEGVDTFGGKIIGLVDKIKEAWNSVDSIKDTFEKFKSGTGVGNALSMIGEMFMNLARKIGNVILAVTGLESVLTEGKLHESMVSFKDVLYNIFVVIKWVFTNIIVPVFGTILEGIKNTLAEMGNAWKRGDLISVLDYIKAIFNTIGSMGIVKLLLSINRLLGSGGILRLIRNISKMFKEIGKYFGAQAANEKASALLKLTVAVGLLISMLFIISQFDDTQFNNLWKSLALLGTIFGGLIVSLIALSLVAQFTWKGLGMLSLAFLSLSLFVGLTVKTIREFSDTITNMTEEQKNSFKNAAEELLVIANDVLAFIGVLALMGRLAGDGMIGIGLTMIGIGTTIYLFVLSLAKTAELIKTYDMATLGKALLIAAGGVAIIVFAMRMLTDSVQYIGTVFKKEKIKVSIMKSLALAATTVIAIATFAFVLLPALEALAQNMDKFTEYCQGIVLFMAMIGTIALSMSMMSRAQGKWGPLNSIGTVLSFMIFVRFAVNEVIPLMDTLRTIKWDSVKGGIAAFSITVLAIAASLYIVAMGIRHIFEGIARINFKSIISMLVGIAGIFLTVSMMSENIESGAVGAGGIFASLGVLLAALVMLGGFILVINRSFRGSSKQQVNATLDSIKMVMALFLTIAGSVLLGVAEIKFLFNGDPITTITAFASITGALVLIVTTVAIAFSSMVKSLSKSLNKGDQQYYIVKTIKTLMNLFLAISLSIMGLVGEIIALTKMGTSWESIIWFFGAITVSVMAILITVSATMSKIVKVIKDSFSTTVKADNIIKMLKTIMAIVITVFAGIAGVMLAINLTTSKNYEWMGGLNLVALGISFALIMTTIGETFDVLISAIQKSFSTTVKAENIVKVLDSIAVVIIAVFAGIAGVMVAIGTTTSKNHEYMGAINLAVLAGAFYLIMSTLGYAFKLLFKSIKDNGIANSQQYKKYMAILITFGAVAAGVLLAIGGAMIMITEATEEQHWVKTAFNTIIMLGTLFVTLSTIGYAFEKIFNTVKKSGINAKEFAIVETVLGVMVVAILEMGYLVKALSEAELANSWDIVPVVLGVIGIIAAITFSMYALINTLKGITLEAQDVAILVSTLGTMLLAIVLFGTSVLPQMALLKPENTEAILAACTGLTLILAAIGGIMSLVIVVIDRVLGRSSAKSVLLALLTLYGTFFALQLFGESIVSFFTGFKGITSSDVGAALLAIGGLLGVITIFSVINAALAKIQGFQIGTGFIFTIIEMVAMFGVLAMYKDSITEFFAAFKDISSDDVGAALLAIGGLSLVVSVLGIVLQKLVTMTGLAGIVGIVGFIALLFGIAWALDYAGPKIANFFYMFESIEDGSVWKGILALGALAAIMAILGTSMTGFIVGVASFIASIIGMAVALELLAGAIISLRIAFGDTSYITYMQQLGDAMDKAFRSKKGIDSHSPSKKFEKSGKFIDMGLAIGIEKNAKLATKAATMLGVDVNDSFQDEMGIHSPSKVFYENGRFIVRGLANGVNSKLGQLNNTGYDMGTNIADGIADGLGNGGIWEGLFGGEDMESYFKKLAGEGGDGLLDSLLNNEYKLGWDKWDEKTKAAYAAERGKMLAEQEAEIKRLQNSRSLTGEQKGKALTEARNRHAKELQDLYNRYASRSDGIGGVINTSISSGISNGFNIEDLTTKFGSIFGDGFSISGIGTTLKEWIGDGFGDVLGENGLGGLFDGFGGKMESAFGGLGNFADTITNSFNLSEFSNQLPNIMENAIGNVFNAFGIGEDPEEKRLKELYEKLEKTEGAESQNTSYLGKLYRDSSMVDEKGEYYTTKNGKKIYKSNISAGWVRPENQDVGIANRSVGSDTVTRKFYYNTLQDLIKRYNNADNSKKDTTRKAVIDYYKQYGNAIETYINSFSGQEKGMYGISDLPSWITDSYENTADNTKTTADNTKLTDEDIKKLKDEIPGLLDENGKVIVDGITSDSLTKEDIVSAIKEAELQTNKDKEKEAYANKPKIGWGTLQNSNIISDYTSANYGKTYKEVYDNFKALAISQGKTEKEINEWVALGFSESWGQTWDSESKQWLFDIELFLKKVKEKLGIASPSEVFAEIAKYCILGMTKGFDDNSGKVLTTVGDLMDEVELEVQNGVMPNSGPILTPVLDDSNIYRRYLTSARSIGNPNVEATASSFDRDIPDYSERFTSLENAMLNTNNLISGIIDMLENGSIVNVDVDVKPVPDNIYDSVIKTNYQRFRQSGHNGFLMR